MKKFQSLKFLFLGMAGLLLLGCNGDDGGDEASNTASTNTGTEAATYPKINGQWSGVFYRTDELDRLPVQATIQQSADAVIINTTKEGTAQTLTGTMKEDGNLRLTDAYDGETWTTRFGPATATRVTIYDYVAPPVESNTPLYVLDLQR